MSRYISPHRLRPGDRIALVAPSSPISPEQIAAGMGVIRGAGLEPVPGENLRCLRSRGLHAASVEDCLREFTWAVDDPTVAGIVSGEGGFGAARLLPHLPYGRIASAAKPVMGFSDFTAINTAILARSGLVTFNGPSASVRVDDEGHRAGDTEALRDALVLLMDASSPWGVRPFARNRGLPRCVYPGRARGPAVGGNLTTLACMLGTPFLPPLEGAVLFLEDIDEGGYELARTLLHLRLAGVLDAVAAVVFGEFAKAPEQVDPGDPSVEDAIVDAFQDGPPCVAGLNFAHGLTGAVIPIGGDAVVDAEAGMVELDFALDD